MNKLKPIDTTAAHRCSGCGHRWEAAPSTTAELCGDCWRRAQSVLARPVPSGGVNLRAARALARTHRMPRDPFAEQLSEVIFSLTSEIERSAAHWQAIETAPKEQRVLVVLKPQPLESVGEITFGYFVMTLTDQPDGVWTDDATGESIVPTHWLPLPDPPALETA